MIAFDPQIKIHCVREPKVELPADPGTDAPVQKLQSEIFAKRCERR